MPNKTMLCKFDADIYCLPPQETMSDSIIQGMSVTIGDLHANFMKLLFALIQHGIIYDVTPEQYEAFRTLYLKKVETITSLDLVNFREGLRSLKVRQGAILTLIGDEVADRGANDYFILELLQVLRTNQVDVEIIFSNHGMEFIHAYETQTRFFSIFIGRGANQSQAESQARSLEAMQTLIDNGLVSFESIRVLIEAAYKPCLKLLSFRYDGGEDSFHLVTHAPVGLADVEALCKYLGVPYDAKHLTREALAHAINTINDVFRQYVRSNTIHTLYNRQGIERVTNENPVAYFAWNRDLKRLNRSTPISFPLYFLHGHHPVQSEEPNVYNLDNYLGKGDGFYFAEYSALCVRALAPLNRKTLISFRGVNYESREFLTRCTGVILTTNDALWGEAQFAQAMNAFIKKEYIQSISLFNEAVSRSKCNNVKFICPVSFKVKSAFRKEKLCWTLPA